MAGGVLQGSDAPALNIQMSGSGLIKRCSEAFQAIDLAVCRAS